jgi:hypothetical protein
MHWTHRESLVMVGGHNPRILLRERREPIGIEVRYDHA